MIMQPPKIDFRDKGSLIRQMKEMAPYYTPEWRFNPENPDPGSALFLLFADMFMGNIHRLNRVPMKNFIAFMNSFDVSLLTARPATAYITFTLSEGTPNSVLIPKGTQISADAPEGSDDEIFFETMQNVLITPAKLMDVYNVSKMYDSIIHIERGFPNVNTALGIEPFDFFSYPESENLQAHSLFIGHRDMFNIREGARIELQINNSLKKFKESALLEKLCNPSLVEWSYGTKKDWKLFDEVKLENHRIILIKKQRVELIEQEIDELENRWIQCRLKQRKYNPFFVEGEEPEMDGIRMRSQYLHENSESGIYPEFLFHNDIQLDQEGFYPFGEHFLPLAEFYVSSQEALSKKHALITMKFYLKTIPNKLGPEPVTDIEWKLIMKESKFDKPEITRISVVKVIWEYWNGNTWVILLRDKPSEGVFYYPSEFEQTIQFICPEDIEETFVNSHLNFWIRAKIVSIDNQYAANSIYLSPWIEQVKFDYSYLDCSYPVHGCISFNNLEFINRTGEVSSTGRSFRPYYSVDGNQGAVYLGFDTPPLKGPTSLYISLKQQKYIQEDRPIIEWEYLARQRESMEWLPLKIVDETDSLTQSGTVQFAGPANFVNNSLFGKDLYWIRIVNRDQKFETLDDTLPIPVVKGLHLNTIKTIQRESIFQEFPEKIISGVTEYYQLYKYPLVSEEVWIDETDYLSEIELEELKKKHPECVQVEYDAEESVQKIWVLWKSVEDFHNSTSEDRHYKINQTSGQITFGEGRRGRIPPNLGVDKIKVNYEVIDGKIGNVEALQIKNLQQSLAFVDTVFNPEPAGGGCDMESLEEVIKRGPKVLKHRNRAVTAEDFEWLARQAYPNIAKIKCMANYNVNMEKEIGAITIIALPKGGGSGLQFFPELKKQVEAYLLERAANTVAFPGKIQVIQPIYLEISIYAVIAVNSPNHIIPVEIQSLAKLNKFLDPFTGNYEEKGWEIGQSIHSTIFYALLQSVRDVSHVDKLFMTVHKIENDDRSEISLVQMEKIINGIVVNGKHKVEVQAL